MVKKTFHRSGEQHKNPVLRGREKADVAIVGGGLTGITTAVWLCRAGLSVALVEAEVIGYGASGRCAGVLALYSGLSYAQMEAKHGAANTHAYAQTHIKAIQAICEFHTKQERLFNLLKTQGLIVAAAGEGTSLSEEASAMKKAGIDVCLEGESLNISPAYLLNAYEYLQTLAAHARALGVRIFEHSRVTAVEADVVYTETGSIQAPYIVIATGYPIINTPGWFFIRMEQRSIHQTLLKGAALPDQVIFALDGSFLYRPLGRQALLQTRGAYVGARAIKPQAEKSFANRYGVSEMGESVTAIETYSADGLPYIGAYSAQTPNLFVATGYGGDGLAGSVIAAQSITARILGLPSEGYEIYSPQRTLGQLSVPLHLGKRYAKGLFGGSEAPRCSHMGCRLVLNRVTRLWECPCHGSRFDGIGRVINAPATRAAQLRNRK